MPSLGRYTSKLGRYQLAWAPGLAVPLQAELLDETRMLNGCRSPKRRGDLHGEFAQSCHGDLRLRCGFGGELRATHRRKM